MPAALTLLLDSTQSDVGTDRFEVWVCAVPVPTNDPSFNRSNLRLPLEPAVLTGLLNTYVSAFYSNLSHGLYTPGFVTGGIHAMTADETPQQCLDAALDQSAPTSSGVLAVATAENAPTAPGGFATAGTPCSAAAFGACPARSTRRGAYVGASDFHPDWGPEPAVDLEEHEIGHMLGWTHSGLDHGEGHSSGIDLMSDSAAPRDFDAERRDGQDTLGINRLAARWLPLSDIRIAASTAAHDQKFDLSPSTGPAGARLLLLPVDTQRFLTVEYLPKSGLDSFFPHGGVTVTLIDQSPSACGHQDRTPCTGSQRRQVTEVGAPPFYSLLTSTSPAWRGFGWSITVQALTNTDATVTAAIQQ